jgi:hypothetical protein
MGAPAKMKLFVDLAQVFILVVNVFIFTHGALGRCEIKFDNVSAPDGGAFALRQAR